MANPEVLNLAAILAPIPGAAPCGTDLRQDTSQTSPYEELRDLRRKNREMERKLEVPAEGESGADSFTQPDWRAVIEKATRVLCEKSKDLDVVAWLIEGLVRMHGFTGLRDGLRLARELIEQYWDELYPSRDSAGADKRLANLAGLNRSLPTVLRVVPMAAAGEDTRLGWFHYQQAVRLERITDPDQKRRQQEDGGVGMDVFMRAVQATPAAFYRDLVADLQGSQDELTRLGGLLETKCGSDAEGRPLAPTLTQLRDSLEECLDLVKSIAKDKLAVIASSQALPHPVTGSRQGPSMSPDGAGCLGDREDAIRSLQQIAAFFRQNEPHSPIGYALEQVVRWGHMELPDLLVEMIPDGAGRERFEWLGIRVKPAAAESEKESQS